MAWYSTFDYTPPTGTADSAPGGVGGGWTDPNNAWVLSKDGSVYTASVYNGTPWNSAQLVRKASNEASINQKVQQRFLSYGPGSDWIMLRYSAPNGDALNSCYAVNSGQWTTVVNGALGSVNNGNSGAGIQNAIEYDIEITVTQTNVTTTTITQNTWIVNNKSDAFAAGALLSSNTYTDTTPALQNLKGGQGFFGYLGNGQALFVDHFTSFTDIPPSGASLTPSTDNVVVGTASHLFTVGYAGTLSSSTAVTLSDGGAGGTFAPTALTLAAGTNPSATFTYTAAQAGNITLTATPAGMAALTAAVTAVVQGATITMASPSVVLSPYNWTTGLSGGAARTWHTGAYARVYTSGATGGKFNLGPCGGAVFASLQIDDNAWSVGFGVAANGTVNVTLPDTGVHSVGIMLIAIGQTAGRWDGSNCLTINSYVCGAGGVAATASRNPKNILFYGTSIWEGIQADNGSDNYLYDTVFMVGEAMRRLGYEYGNVSCGSSGYAVPVPTGNGGVPAAFVPGNDGASAWNKLDGTGGKRTTGSGASERFVPQPDIIYDEWGANDGLQNVASSVLQPSVAGLYAALRVAAPNALLLKLIPYGGYKRADIIAALASLPFDNLRQIVDLAIDQRQTVYGGVHPGRVGHAQIAPMVLASLLLAAVPLSVARVTTSVG